MMYAIVLLSLLAAARSALRCGRFSDLEEGLQMILSGTNCENPSTIFGACDVGTGKCVIPTLADGTTFAIQEPTTTQCENVACTKKRQLACDCLEIPTCARNVDNEIYVFECVDEDDNEGAEPTDSTWIFLVSTAGAIALIFICCGALAGYNRRRTTYDRY